MNKKKKKKRLGINPNLAAKVLFGAYLTNQIARLLEIKPEPKK